ncbi:hypothetical protein Cgig2_025850 [Carnegiea gigantea]|uniref:histidine--tRNA ligase n=1 Tax=Carnegiea gigantea TaxID=171969 RepID=A0A9Q1Q663_9CARY|nr:hypothetical protein Cgig2_025850 [Carnegiea gigantea]
MAAKPQVAVVTIGGKGSSLSSASVFSVANKLAQVRIDSSIIDKLSSSNNSKSKNSSPSIKYRISFPEFLTLEECRASLTLLLSKLLLISSSIRVDVPNLIRETLNSGLGTESSSSIVVSIDVTEEEKSILDASLLASAVDGVSALLDHGASSLSPVAETVAALSCEASKGKVSAFNLVDSGDGKCLKDEAAVASDLKVLLLGSKLTGKAAVEVNAVSHIPQLYGSFREAIRNVHARARVALNSAVSNGVSGTGKAWETTLTALAAVLRKLGEDSLSRVDLNVGSVGNDSLRRSLTVLVQENFPTKDSLISAYKLAIEAAIAENYVEFAHNVNELFSLVRNVVSWEMVTAVISLKGNELLEEASKVETNGVSTGTEKKNEKKKKLLGKGTEPIVQFIKDRLKSSLPDAVDVFANFGRIAENLRSFLDPRVPDFVDFSEKIKEIVESNEIGRLPKLPKEQMTVREKAFSVITEVFKRHGAMALDTPVFELRETLMGKYGEDSKLIYDLADQVKLNHRKLLDGMLDICGVPPEKFRTICSSIDKLDKQSFEQVKREMVDEKGLTAETADRIGSFVKERGPPLELLSKLKQEGSEFMKHEGSKLALDELDILFNALDKSKCIEKIVFDLSLARGLDYYTGMIFEAVFKGTTQVIRANETEVLVGIVFGKDEDYDLSLAAEVVNELWSAKIKAEYVMAKKAMKIFERAEASGIPFAVMVGGDERKEGLVKVRDMKTRTEEKVPRDRMIEEVLKRLRNSC